MADKGIMNRLEALLPELAEADHVDVQTVEGRTDLRHFLTGMLNYMPVWLKALYGVRAVFVRLLGMKQESMPWHPLRPEELAVSPGEAARFFTVLDASLRDGRTKGPGEKDAAEKGAGEKRTGEKGAEEGGGEHWLAVIHDQHLSAWVAVFADAVEHSREPSPQSSPQSSPQQGGPLRRFSVCTVVRHRHWTGPVYFAVIKPFHVLVVRCMARHGVRS